MSNEPKLTIEAGKTYRTRDGRKARVYAVDGRNPYPVHGAVLVGSDWDGMAWMYDGRVSRVYEKPHSDDLVSVWRDLPEVDWSVMPKWANWVAMDKSGRWHWHTNEPSQMRFAEVWASDEMRHVVPPQYAPKWSGDWRESLVGRVVNRPSL